MASDAARARLRGARRGGGGGARGRRARADAAAAEPPGDRRRAPAPAEGGPVAAPVPPHARVDEADARPAIWSRFVASTFSTIYYYYFFKFNVN